MTTLERLYLLSSRAQQDLRIIVTVTLPADSPPDALEELQRFFSLLADLYRKLGGSGLRVTRLREARRDAPRLALGEVGRDPADVPVDRFVELFLRWIEAEGEPGPHQP